MGVKEKSRSRKLGLVIVLDLYISVVLSDKSGLVVSIR